MHLKALTKPLVLWLVLASALLTTTSAVDVDTDGDGVVDSEEIAAGTDPANNQSVTWRSLTSWRFSDGTLAGDDGQQPIAANNVTVTQSGFVGPGVQILPGGTVRLKYRATEPSGKPNIAAVRGSLLFRIKPNWSTGVGPGSWVTVLQTTNFSLRFNPDGSALVLTSKSGANTITNAQVSIDVGNFGTYWSYGLVTYSPEQTTLSFDAPSTLVTGPGIAPPANLTDPNNFLSIGSAADGTGAINGLMDEIVAFNAPGVIGLTPVLLSAVTSNNPAGINLIWPSATNAITEVKRRLIGAAAWEKTRAAFGTNFFDQAAIAGERYEYNVNTRVADLNSGLPEDVGQFIKASLKGTPLHSQGKIILLVDKTLTNSIEAELSGFVTNLVGDGWQVLRKDVPRHIDDYSTSSSFYTNYFTITNVIKPFVSSNYALFGSEIKYVLIIGHAPVAYTGTIADDGHNSTGFHGPHYGAWASDHFYGDIDGIWTDQITITSDDLFLFNRNFPGDGKLDQNKIPANALGDAKIEIPVARIDMWALPSFADSEAELLKKYLRKNADYRNGVRTFAADAMAGEYLATPSTMGFELASEMLSKISVLKAHTVGDVFADTRSLLFGVHSGPGFFDRVNDSLPGGLEHTTAQIAAGQTSTNCAFYFLRGSYFPDWNTQDNVLRATLGTTNGGLATGAFLGLSKGWRVGGLAIGYGIGSEMTDIVNTWTIPGNAQSVRSIELLGDPTLRYPILPPPTSLTWTTTNNAVSLKWKASNGAAGYYVYRSTNGALGTFARLTTIPLAVTNYTDTGVPAGNIVYMVRSSALATTGGGTVTNLSQGIFSRVITSADSTSCCIAAQTIDEDSSLAPVQFSLGEAASENGLTLAVSSSNPALVPAANITLAGSGPLRTVAATPLPDQFGSAVLTITAQTALSTVVRTFTLTVLPVNDAPSFTKGGDPSVAQGSGAQTLTGWATAISPGPANEASQQVSFVVTNDSPALFLSQPAVSANGTLSFTPDPAQRGLAHVTVQAKDNGGIANAGIDSSYLQTFNITLGLPLDTDSDGLPDDFELYYGFNPNVPGDGTLDWDGDGMTNAEELAAGTNPKNSRSSIRINSAHSLSPTFAVQFNTVAGKLYSLEANDSFPDLNGWQSLYTGILGTGSLVEQTDPSAVNSARRVYRVTSAGSGGEEIITEPVGLFRQSLLGNSDTVLSIPFLRPASELASIVSVFGNSLQVRGAGGWQPNQWVYGGGAQPNTYFILIRSGQLAGDIYTITGNSSDWLELDLGGGSLTGIHVGDAIAIIPYWTLGSFFRNGAGINLSPSPADRRTEVLIPDVGGTGTNLSAAATYYFCSGAWRQVGAGFDNKNDEVITPDMYIIVRHNSATSTTVTAEGAVLTGNLRAVIRRNASSQQDNILGLPRPVAQSLDQSGLVTSGVFRNSTSATQHLDELFVFDNTIAGKNKSAVGTYYLLNDTWRQIGFGATDRGADKVFAPGAGIIIRAGSGISVLWPNSPNY